MDIDWAPDWAIEETLNICRLANVPVTLFVTHASPYIDSLRTDPLIEFGIHPNFLPQSSHGETQDEVLKFCMDLVPEATAIRSHALVQSSHLFNLIADRYPNIITDVSLLLPLHQNLQPTDLYAGDTLRRITRLPYFWEDDTLAAFPNWDWNNPIPDHAGLRIFDFHPTFVQLNLAEIRTYAAFKAAVGARPFQNLSRSDFEPFINSGAGCRSALEMLLRDIPASHFHCISEVTRQYREQVS